MIEQAPVIYKISAAIIGNTLLGIAPDIGGVENINNIGIAGLSIGILWIVWKQYEKERTIYRADLKAERKSFMAELKVEREQKDKYHEDAMEAAKNLGDLTHQIKLLLEKLDK